MRVTIPSLIISLTRSIYSFHASISKRFPFVYTHALSPSKRSGGRACVRHHDWRMCLVVMRVYVRSRGAHGTCVVYVVCATNSCVRFRREFVLIIYPFAPCRHPHVGPYPRHKAPTLSIHACMYHSNRVRSVSIILVGRMRVKGEPAWRTSRAGPGSLQ